MAWLLGIAATLLVVFIGLQIVGARLSRVYTSQLEARLAAPPERVFEALQEVERRPISGRQCKAVVDVEREGDALAWTERMGGSEVRYETVEIERDRRIVRRGRDSVVPISFEQRIDLQPAAGGTHLRCATRTEVADGHWLSPVFRVVLTAISGAERANRDYLEHTAAALGETLEAAAT